MKGGNDPLDESVVTFVIAVPVCVIFHSYSNVGHINKNPTFQQQLFVMEVVFFFLKCKWV